MEVTAKDARAAFSEGFIGIDATRLAGMADPELAQWQSGFPIDSAQGILAQREWERRMISHQLQEQFNLDSRLAEATNRAMQFAAIIGVLGALAGAGIGAYATIKASSGQSAPSEPRPPLPAQLESPKVQSIPAKAPASSSSQ